jgi:hypothetical protein
MAMVYWQKRFDARSRGTIGERQKKSFRSLAALQDLCVFYQDMVVCGVDEPSVRLVLKAKINGLYPSLAEFCNSWLEISLRDFSFVSGCTFNVAW